jgi:hypothetical protein
VDVRERAQRLEPSGSGADRQQVLELEPPDRPAAPADADELGGDGPVVGSEHRADRGHDDVEAPTLERQVLGVGLDPGELEPLPSARGREALPVPAATSRTCIPAPMPQALTSRGPSGRRKVSTIEGKSPVAHIARWRALSSGSETADDTARLL